MRIDPGEHGGEPLVGRAAPPVVATPICGVPHPGVVSAFAAGAAAHLPQGGAGPVVDRAAVPVTGWPAEAPDRMGTARVAAACGLQRALCPSVARSRTRPIAPLRGARLRSSLAASVVAPEALGGGRAEAFRRGGHSGSARQRGARGRGVRASAARARACGRA